MKLQSHIKPMTITGVKVAYYFICHTKLWLFSHNIRMERESEDVLMGKHIHESRYQRRKKDIIIDNAISIDFVKKGDVIEVHDIKKSRKMEDAHRWQLTYYVYYLHQRGVKARGVLNYPLLNKKEIVEPTEEDFKTIEQIMNCIIEIVSGEMPTPSKRKLCNRCSYVEFCFGGE
ncbi:MAG: CRISPR-associated protein Cas4 [Methanocellales archaeon]|nr:CRISPR-associated protein Cas4 [Methanocellales archaeon]MDD3292156.1 CRISPR-associated protein Cas4 [Methanocellales archaeon]MDD5235393.1 CRISPR-associated protein Cas4 [Methanocellales archaeon]MDD5485659.1 CRISPR-associated protein Cas4 [Methanocellales archaeon]